MGRHLAWKRSHRNNSGGGGVTHRLWCLIFVVCVFWLIVARSNPYLSAPTARPPPIDRCSGRYIYVHDLPARFNSDMLRDCRTLNPWTDMCRFTSNGGLGPPLNNSGGVLSGTGWYATNQFALEIIFHNRVKRYDCLTLNSSLASAIFVPFYAGLDVARYLWGHHNTSERDSASLDLARWLTAQPEWAAMGGRDHFMVAGRITWDFRRRTDENGDWGNKLLTLPELKNMTALVIESSPWHSNDFAIPYPSYFHPSSAGEVAAWQERMRAAERRWLFSFAGAPRPEQKTSIRGWIINQCRDSPRCELLDRELDSPERVMGVFEGSTFCLQPPGDSYTRRSAFDAMVAGCVPVFFHPGSAYVQYTWHLPSDYKRYSVFVPEGEVREGRVRIEEVLMGIGEKEVRRMREEVIGLIPRLVYGDPRSPEMGRDAFDVAVEGVVERVRKVREGAAAAAAAEAEAEEMDSWKYGLVGSGGGEHEWDHFFSFSDEYNSNTSKA